MWSGYPKDYNSAESLQYLDKVRKLIFEGKNKEADKLAEEKLAGFYSETFLPLGEVKIKISGAKSGGYMRSLDLSTAIHNVCFGEMQRECFASNPDKVVCYSIKSTKTFSINVSAKSKLSYSVTTDNGLNLTGNAPDYVAPNYVISELFPVKYNEGKGMAFALRVIAETDGKIGYSSNKMHIKNATRVNLFFATATGFNGFDKMPEINRGKVLDKCKNQLKINIGYETIKQKHIEDFKSQFEKSMVTFVDEMNKKEVLTSELIELAKKGNVTPQLAELFYNFGKYMIVSGSRKGGEPLNLQGQWNNSIRPPWSSNYTVNINTQMNYWGASMANLDDSIEPFLKMVYEVVQNGKKTAKINYGCGGFACNHNVDIWRKTPPVKGTCNYMLEPLCGVWLANEVFAHYKNGTLQEYKEKVFEIAKEAAQFSADYLVLHDGKYVICPSASAENQFVNKNGEKCSLGVASAFDMGLVKQAFCNYLSLDINDNLSDKIQKILPDLYDFQYGKTGIIEFDNDYEMPERGHRHFSPLYAFYPANQIKYYKNAKQTEQVRKLFLDRISHSNQYIGWSAAWGICLATRLHDNKNTKGIMQKFLGHAVFKNLFCYHPPFYFQIDGNLGFVAAVHEMLVYEEDGVIELLPALPDNLLNGSVKDLLINGVRLSFEWENGKVVNVFADKSVKILNKNLADNAKLNDNVCLSNK